MNDKQRRVILCGFVVILLMGIFPPWKMYVANPIYGGESLSPIGKWAFEDDAGYAWLFTRPSQIPEVRQHNASDETIIRGVRVDTSLLLCQWFLVSAITGIIVMFSGDRPRVPTDKPDNNEDATG